jgi:hypothetical protein
LAFCLGLSLQARAQISPWPDAQNCTSTNACLNIGNTSTGTAVMGTSAGGGPSVYGANTSSGAGVYGNNSSSGAGVFGNNSSSGDGVHGVATSSTHSGVYGTNTGTGYGIFADGGQNALGLIASAVNANAIQANSTNRNGVYGASSSANYSGVVGENSHGTAINGGSYDGFAVFGQCPFGWAVYANGKAGGTTNWTVDSDRRLKKDITDSSYGLREVLGLRPVSYRLKAGDERTRLGFVAQDVEKIVPEVVSSSGKDHMLGVEYSSLIPVLAKAIQEQQRLIDAQQARIAALERGRSPALSSLLPGGILAFCLVPLGLVARRRRRNEHP